MNEAFLPLIVTSPSGGGKTTLVRRLLERFPDMMQSVSYTTRPPRGAERDGRDYHFVSRETFDKLVAEDALAEWAEVHGQRYGTSLARIEAARATHAGVVFVIDVQGARQIKARLGEAVAVFVLPPSFAVLEERLRARGSDSPEVIAQRLSNARGELEHYGLFDHLVVNDDLEVALDELAAVVRAERTRRWRRAGLVERVLRGASTRDG